MAEPIEERWVCSGCGRYETEGPVDKLDLCTVTLPGGDRALHWFCEECFGDLLLGNMPGSTTPIRTHSWEQCREWACRVRDFNLLLSVARDFPNPLRLAAGERWGL